MAGNFNNNMTFSQANSFSTDFEQLFCRKSPSDCCLMNKNIYFVQYNDQRRCEIHPVK